MKTIWQKTAEPPRFERLERDINTDVAIIGGGLCGLLCAHMLERAGVECALIDAGRICGGVSARTTAKITSQHGLIYEKLIKRFGIERTRLYLEANQAALAKYRLMCRNIDCDFEDKDNYVYSLNDRAEIAREVAAARELGFDADMAEEIPLPIKIAGAARFRNQAQFNPMKFASAIAPGLRIYERTRALELIGSRSRVFDGFEKHEGLRAPAKSGERVFDGRGRREGLRVRADGGEISAKRVVIATHFPFIDKHGMYFMKLYQQRSYVIAYENAPDVGGMYVDAANGLSFRNYANALLVGGGGHRTGKAGEGFRAPENFARRNYPEAREICRWATQDCVTLDVAPYIGKYGKNTEGLYVATGFNKWGMTSSMVAATLLCDMLTGKYNPYAEVFSPSRSMLHTQLGVNIAETLASYINPSPKRCPHMGCALKWNDIENTWDCPCHGSRFTHDGKLINNPATGDLEK